jgi:hypothetical protein
MEPNEKTNVDVTHVLAKLTQQVEDVAQSLLALRTSQNSYDIMRANDKLSELLGWVASAMNKDNQA